MHNKGIVASLAGALMLITTAPALAQAPQSEVRHDLRPGDRVERHGLGLVVGPRGTVTKVHAIAAEGADEVVSVLTHPDGTVVITSGTGESGADAFSTTDPAATDSPDACVDDAYTLSKFSFTDGTQKAGKWKERFDWYYKANSTPASIDVAEARTKITEATSNITASRNDCGLTDTVTATHSRVGDTTVAADFTSNSECRSYAAKDNRSVVDWGRLANANYLAVECTWGSWNGTDTYVTHLQSDVRINTSFNWYATTKPVTCLDVPATGVVTTRYYSLEDVMTHERGHSFGVGHVGEAGHGNLTMSENSNGPCQESGTTLGLGDVRALRALY